MVSDRHDPTVQESYNGPLTSNFRERIRIIKESGKVTYKDIADEASLSSAFIGNLARGYRESDKRAAAVRTIHVQRLKNAVEKFENRLNLSTNKTASGATDREPEESKGASQDRPLTLAEAKRGLSLAFEVPEDKIQIIISS